MKLCGHVPVGIALIALVCGQSGCGDRSQPPDQTHQVQPPAVATTAEPRTQQEQTQQAQPPAVTTTTVSPVHSFLGKSEDEVLSELGPPQGKLRSKGRTVWTYERGNLEFTNGIVAVSQIMSPDQYEHFELARQKRLEEDRGLRRTQEELQLQRDALSLQRQNAATDTQSQQQERDRRNKASKRGYVARSRVIGGEVITSVATESPQQLAAHRTVEERYRKKLIEIDNQFRVREREDRAIFETSLKSQSSEIAQKHYDYLQQRTSDAKRDAKEQARTDYENELSQIGSGN
jgi:hypothetical protein